MLSKARRDYDDAKKLKEICEIVDSDGSRTITAPEFMAFMRHDECRRYFDVKGINVKDAQMFFNLMCAAGGSENQEVDLESFVNGCMRLTGVASGSTCRRWATR